MKKSGELYNYPINSDIFLKDSGPLTLLRDDLVKGRKNVTKSTFAPPERKMQFFTLSLNIVGLRLCNYVRQC